MLGVTGGIAAYKAAELLRELVKASAETRVMMTEAATHFVGPLTFETLSLNSVLTDLFPQQGGLSTAHIDWARWPDAIILCPATANTIGKIAAGIADNAVTTTVLATTAPVIFCPAMNKEMYANPAYQANQKKLIDWGYHFVAPGVGELACGEEGLGRLADKEDILDALKKTLFGTKEFDGKRILITAGPTQEPLDPVRFLSNRSSGKMGYALAEKAAIRGAKVTLISGPSQQRPFYSVDYISVQTAVDMNEAVMDNLEEADVLIMAAAVSDFRPKQTFQHKIKKSDDIDKIELERNPDILARAREKKGSRIHVGFSVETENEIENSTRKLFNKGLDFIVVNNPLEQGSGFATDTNRVRIIDKDGQVEALSLMSKSDVADKILDKVLTLLKQ